MRWAERDNEGVASQFAVLRYIETPEDIAAPVIDGSPLADLLPERYPGLALSLVDKPARRPRTILMEPKLIVRESTMRNGN